MRYRFFSAESYSFCGEGSDADRAAESDATAAAVHVLEISGVAAPGSGAAIVGGSAQDARACVGSGQRALDLDHAGRVGPGNFTPSRSQIPDMNLSIHPARAIQ